MFCFGPSRLTTTTNFSLIVCNRFHEEKKKKKEEVKSIQAPVKIRTIHYLRRINPTAIIASNSPSPPSAMILASTERLTTLIKGVIILLQLPFRRKRRPQKAGKEEEEEEIRHGSWPVAIWKQGRDVARDLDVATRRAIAIRRVAEDSDNGTVREFFMFVTSRGETMFSQSWTPASGDIRALVVVLHGLNEHSGRYDSFAKQLNANGYKVYGMDWIGHGGSNGLHGYVHSLDEVVSDTKEFLEEVLAESPGFPCFIFGHSTGAAIVLKAVLDPKVEALIKGMMLTSPAIRVQPSHPIILVLAPFLSLILPKYQLSAANKQGVPVSRDPDALVAKYSDPLVYTGPVRVRTGYEILRITSYLQRNLSKVRIPFLVLHGTADTLTDPEASQKLYEEACSTEKSIKLYRGFLHDLLFEPEREEVVKDIIDWLNSKLQV